MTDSEKFDLTPKQYSAVDLCIDPRVKELMLYGGSRSGKTFLALYFLFLRAAREPNSRHVALRLNFAHAKQSLWLDTIPKLLAITMPDLGAKPNKTDYYYTLPNGSEVWIGGLDDVKRVEKILGKEYSTIYFNECSQLDFESVTIAKTRLAQKNALKKLLLYDQNPPKKSHWSYWYFEKKLNPEDDEPLDNPEGLVSILMNPGDNIDNLDPGYLEMLSKLPEKQRNRFLLGLYDDQSDGNAYHAFDRQRHVRDDIKQLPGTVYVAMDFNVDPMCASLFQIIDDTIQVFDEVYLRNSDTHKMCAELKRRGYGGLQVIPDSTGRNRKTSGQTDFQILKENGFTIMSTYNPLQSDRVNNVNRLFNLDEILISSKCKKLIGDLEKVVWKDNKLDQTGANKLLTHSSDTLGYGAWKLKPFTKIDLTPGSGKR